MTDFANLVVGVDSRQVKEGTAELDNLTASGKRAEDQVDSLKGKTDRLEGSLGSAATRAEKMALAATRIAEAEKLAAVAGVELTQSQLAAVGSGRALASTLISEAVASGKSAEATLAASAAHRQGAASALARAAAEKAAAGATAAGAGSAASFAAVLGGPFNIAIFAAVSLLGDFAFNLLRGSDSAETQKNSVEDLIEALDDLNESTDRAVRSTEDSIKANLAEAIALEQRARKAREAAVAELELARATSRTLAATTPTSSNSGIRLRNSADVRAEQEQARIDQLNGKLERTAGNIRTIQSQLVDLRLDETFDKGAAATGKYNRTLSGLNAELKAGSITLGEYAQRSLAAKTALEAEQATARKATGATRDRKAAMSEVEKEYKRAKESTDRYIESLELEIAKIGKTPTEIRQLEIVRAKDAAATDAQRQAIEKLNVSRERELKAVEAQKAAEKNRDIETQLQRQRAELDLLRLTGIEREKMALIIAEQAEVEAVLVQIMEAERAGNTALAEQLRERIRLIQQAYAVSREGLDIADQAKESAEKLQLVNDELRQMIGLLGNLGAAGSVIGGLLGIVTGNVSAIGGPIGELLNIRTGVTTDQNGSIIARTIGDELRDIFGGENSPFVKSMQSALQGAGTGLIAANALGFTGTGSQIGSAIGGALGETLGKEFLTKGLESIASGLGGAAGPLGAIAGGLLGGALGSLLSSTPRGSATIGNVGGALGVTGTRGTSQARIAASEKSAGAIIDSLDALAAELGATIDPTSGSVSIGIRKGNYRVDTTGSGITKTKNGAVDFGQDAEAAALFAMQDLIRDGVLVGLRKGTENLLKNASDLEVGVQKALAFEGVFTELKALQDPLGSALDTLDKEFTRLRDIFEEAGATAEEYAQLEELLTIKRQDAIDDSIQRQIDDLSQRNDLEVELLRLLGREEEALAQAREYELATMEDTLRPLQLLIYQLQDANAIIAQFSPLSDDLKAFRNELLGGGNDAASVGFLATRFRSTASLASQGDADALGQLRGTASDFLEAARDNASSALEYQRAVGEVLGAVDSGIFAADAQIEYAQLTIDAIDANRDELLQVRRELATTQQQIVENTSALRRLWERYDGDGLTIKSDQDTPIFIKTAPGDTVTTA